LTLLLRARARAAFELTHSPFFFVSFLLRSFKACTVKEQQQLQQLLQQHPLQMNAWATAPTDAAPLWRLDSAPKAGMMGIGASFLATPPVEGSTAPSTAWSDALGGATAAGWTGAGAGGAAGATIQNATMGWPGLS